MSNKAPIVWLLTDQKPGHLNQLRGLAQRLEAKVNAQCHIIDVSSQPLSLYSVWRGINLAPELPIPDLVVAAGSGTQRALLAAKRQFGKPVVLLMKPNFPYAWLDAALVPEHDKPPSRDNVFVTQGVLNSVEPRMTRDVNCLGMILIGGPSKHYGWNDGALVAQVRALCEESSQREWVLSDSRRTPAGLIKLLADQKINNLTCHSHKDTEPNWLSDTLVMSSPVWVTPDSVSMVYEALTSGAATGLFSLPDAQIGRVTCGIDRLLKEGRLVAYSDRQQMSQLLKKDIFWEAERAASWVVTRFFKDCLV